MAKGILVFAEQRDGQLRKVTYELLYQGRKLADQLGVQLSVALAGNNLGSVMDVIKSYGPDKVYVADDAQLSKYTTDAYSTVITQIVEQDQPAVFLLGNTAMGKDLAPRVAQRLGTGLISDIVSLDTEGGLTFRKPIYAGKAFTKVAIPEVLPAMVTVRPNVLGAGEPAGDKGAEVINVPVKLDPGSLRTLVREMITKSAGRVELTEADIIVSGGRGMKGPENYVILEALADVIGAAVGASRAAVDAGWREPQFQVGQTGKTVSPQLYIACGISGAIQHLAGMGSSKFIVAINKDPEANIFNVADYGIVDDLFKVVPILTEEFKKLLS
ncbi:MAG: electron transfer flavoprotein subunit alpha/FixB family protein [Bacillota bacterium]